jgi:hypothetical protein
VGRQENGKVNRPTCPTFTPSGIRTFPRPPSAVYFLWHFPWARARWLLAITVPCAVRTFLRRGNHAQTNVRANGAGGRLAHSAISYFKPSAPLRLLKVLEIIPALLAINPRPARRRTSWVVEFGLGDDVERHAALGTTRAG